MTTSINDFDYILPPGLIASSPAEIRSGSRMLVLHRSSGECEHQNFADFPGYLRPGDCLVLNNTKVIKARLNGFKNGAGARMEFLLITQLAAPRRWSCLVKPAKRVAAGTRVRLEPPAGSATSGEAWLTVIERQPDGLCVVEFDANEPFQILDRYGHVPLPPYLKRPDHPEDTERYQTVFAKNEGAVAAPTAGLHFDQATISAIKQQGVRIAELTLHVGPGTFLPVKVDNIEEHTMHKEWFDLPVATADTINAARQAGGRICAVGTTSLRVLETQTDRDRLVKAGSGWTDIFIRPPHTPRSADLLLTNFHLPKSTLLMLVCAFAGREHVLRAYVRAVAERYRFYSYGDCMLITTG